MVFIEISDELIVSCWYQVRPADYMMTIFIKTKKEEFVLAVELIEKIKNDTEELEKLKN